MKIAVVDNYDSFTYNLVHLVEKISGTEVSVYKNDQVIPGDLDCYDRIILSPGPGLPMEAGMLVPLIRYYAAHKNILGVCLGQQAIAEAFGGRLVNLQTVYHGVATSVQVTDETAPIFAGIDQPFQAGRYHSWVVNEDYLPAELKITARDEHGFIMALQHKVYQLHGVQFHPESVLTPVGEKILSNWINFDK